MDWKIIDTGISSAAENMRFDAELLEGLDLEFKPILHFYEWEKDSATFGHFIRPEQFLDLSVASEVGLELAKRPTGGGIVFHLWDMAFSVLVPAGCPLFSENTLENYAFVNRAVLSAVQEFLQGGVLLSLTPEDLNALDTSCSHFCMAKPTKYDVMWEGRKVAGAAQRKTRKGFLHQGTIALMPPCKELLSKLLLPGLKVEEAMQLHTSPLLGSHPSQEEVAQAKIALKELLATHLSNASSTIPS